MSKRVHKALKLVGNKLIHSHKKIGGFFGYFRHFENGEKVNCGSILLESVPEWDRMSD
jgi:hypothetical protein